MEDTRRELLHMRELELGTTIIGVARTPHSMRQRSTLARKLAHVLLHHARGAKRPLTLLLTS